MKLPLLLLLIALVGCVSSKQSLREQIERMNQRIGVLGSEIRNLERDKVATEAGEPDPKMRARKVEEISKQQREFEKERKDLAAKVTELENKLKGQ